MKLRRTWILLLAGLAVMLSACGGSADTGVLDESGVPELVTATATPASLKTSPPPTATMPAPTPTSMPEPPTPAPLPPTPTPVPVEIITEIAYVEDGNPKHLATLYRPLEGEGPFPTILIYHSGQFWAGDAAYLAAYEEVGRFFAGRGYAVVVPGYRVSQTDPYPAAVEDAFCAAAWVHAAAGPYGFDATRVASFGLDAGGNLAAMIGTVDEPERFLTGCPHPVPEQPWVRGIAAMNGYYDLASTFANAVNMTFPPYLKSYLQAEPEEASERYAEASPITWIDGSEPPFALIHNQTPYLFRVKQITEAFAAELEAYGVPVKVAAVAGSCPMMLPISSQVLASLSDCGSAPTLADYGILEAEAFFAELFSASE